MSRVSIGEVSTQIEKTPFVSAGIRRNGKKEFSFIGTGLEFYDLLKLLDDKALEDTNIVNVRALVLWAEKIRIQLGEQGFLV